MKLWSICLAAFAIWVCFLVGAALYADAAGLPRGNADFTLVYTLSVYAVASAAIIIPALVVRSARK